MRFRRGWLDAVDVPRLEDVLERVHGNKYGEMDSVRWQPTSWARALRAHRSLTRVVVEELVPMQSDGSFANELLPGKWYWRCWAGPRGRGHDLEPFLFDALKGGQTVEGEPHLRFYDTREAALDSLAVAVCEVVRGHG